MIEAYLEMSLSTLFSLVLCLKVTKGNEISKRKTKFLLNQNSISQSSTSIQRGEKAEFISNYHCCSHMTLSVSLKQNRFDLVSFKIC